MVMFMSVTGGSELLAEVMRTTGCRTPLKLCTDNWTASPYGYALFVMLSNDTSCSSTTTLVNTFTTVTLLLFLTATPTDWMASSALFFHMCIGMMTGNPTYCCDFVFQLTTDTSLSRPALTNGSLSCLMVMGNCLVMVPTPSQSMSISTEQLSVSRIFP